ncbi:MAG: SDR family oxidoreductase [Pseudomonadota bacterium]
MNIDFAGKKAIVTGGTRGIGNSIASMLDKSGCEVIYTGTKEKAENRIGSARYEQLDLACKKSIERFSDEVIKTSEKIDILINNAGINFIEPIDKIQDQHWEAVLNVNLTGAMCLTREVAKTMIKQKNGGRILNVSSIFGIVSKAKRGSYSASKAGMIGLSRACALDLAPYSILVNALCPGFTVTELTASILSPDEMAKLAKEEVPLGRFAEVDEISKVALFLCSDMNTYLTGQTIVVDGGMVIR